MKNLWLGLTLIVAASAVLLISDWSQRSSVGSLKRVAIVQHASQAALAGC